MVSRLLAIALLGCGPAHLRGTEPIASNVPSLPGVGGAFCPDEKGHLGIGVFGEIDAIPAAEFEHMFFKPEYIDLCAADIFSDPLFLDTVQKLPKYEDDNQLLDRYYASFQGRSPPSQLTDIQRGMAKVFDRINGWRYVHEYCPSARKSDNCVLAPLSAVRMHAYYDTDKNEIVIYKSACTERAKDMYGMGLRDLELTHRFWLIAAHELGHAIDFNARGLSDWRALSSAERGLAERWATAHGVVIAECYSRSIRKFFYEYLMDAGVNDLIGEGDEWDADETMTLEQGLRTMTAIENQLDSMRRAISTEYLNQGNLERLPSGRAFKELEQLAGCQEPRFPGL